MAAYQDGTTAQVGDRVIGWENGKEVGGMLVKIHPNGRGEIVWASMSPEVNGWHHVSGHTATIELITAEKVLWGEAQWDIFISHATEDKDEIARPLANLLAAHGYKVWLDEAEIFVGDSLRGKIEEGLAHSKYGVAIISPHFLTKQWPQSELDGLVSKEAEGKKVILPIWHNVSVKDVAKHSPMLAGRVAASTEEGLREVARKIAHAIYENRSGNRPGFPIFGGRLTKKVLMNLPAGSFLTSNILTNDHAPAILYQLGGLETREEVWRQLRELGLTGTKFYVYRTESDYRRHRFSWRNPENPDHFY